MVENRLLYIAGPGHSGSTLLDMLLGGHPLVSSLGEIHRFYLSLQKHSLVHRCDCGSPLPECPFWRQVINQLTAVTGRRKEELQETFVTTDPEHLLTPERGMVLEERSVPPSPLRDPARILVTVLPRSMYSLLGQFYPRLSLFRRIAINSHLLFDAVRQVADTPIVVDSTKNPVRLKILFNERPTETLIINLRRDGRAVCHSRMKRLGVDMPTAARVWKREHWKQTVAQSRVPSEQVTFVKYEDLCKEPESALQAICGFLGIPFDRQMLDFRRPDRHAIGGNPMRFRSGDRRIRLIEDWRQELASSDLESFERIAGDFNRKIGYGS